MIKSKTKTIVMNWQSIKLFQPDDIKKEKNKYSLSKFDKSLKENGLIDTIKAFEVNEENSNNFQGYKKGIYALDGHLRLKQLKKLKKDGVDIDDNMEVSLIDCKSIGHAKLLYAIINSNYRKFDESNFFSWMNGVEIEPLAFQSSIIGIDDMILNNYYDMDFDQMHSDKEISEKDKLEKIKEYRKEMNKKYQNEEKDLSYVTILFETPQQKFDFMERYGLLKTDMYINGLNFEKIFNKQI